MEIRGLLVPDLVGFVNFYRVGGKYGLSGLHIIGGETTLIDLVSVLETALIEHISLLEMH